MQAIKNDKEEKQVLVNIPLPIFVEGVIAGNVQSLLNRFIEVCGAAFAENQIQGKKLCVHSIHFLAVDKLVFFVEVDEFAGGLKSQHELAETLNSKLKQVIAEEDCDHEYGDGGKCVHCGKKL